MILTSYYNEANEVLTITKNNKEVTNIEVNGDTTLMYNLEEVIGINVFNVTGFKSGLVSIDQIDSKTLDLFGEEEKKPSIVYGEILNCTKHPKSEKLQVCNVLVGEEELQIVCGASNCSANNSAIVALVGAVMPSGLVISPGELMGEKSNGMLCSLNELGMSNQTGAGIALYEVGSVEVGSSI